MNEFNVPTLYVVYSPESHNIESSGFNRCSSYAEAFQLALQTSRDEGWANIKYECRLRFGGSGEHTLARFVRGHQSFGYVPLARRRRDAPSEEFIYSLPHRGVDCPHGCPDHSAYG